jgi:hypothetical protein
MILIAIKNIKSNVIEMKNKTNIFL